MHALAGMIYASSHRDMDVKPPEPREGHYYQFEGTDQFYVNFYHTRYRHFEDYPFGLLNVVGYWAETELLGGVVLFERGQSNSEVHSIPTSLVTPMLTHNRSSTLSYTRRPQMMLSSSPKNSSRSSPT